MLITRELLESKVLDVGFFSHLLRRSQQKRRNSLQTLEWILKATTTSPAKPRIAPPSPLLASPSST
jgi:hypothetical protein